MQKSMEHGLLGNNVITQVGIVVRDIEKSTREFADFFGIEKPEPTRTGGFDQARTTFRGADTPARAKLAFMDFGSLQIELIEPDEYPSTWRNYLDTHGEGVHHLAFAIKGMDEKIAAVEAHGCPLQQRGEYAGGRYAYLDASGPLKTVIELLEND
jgi:methylmalonyl-CoA/ethylmalonyl-CoA epimerase